MHLLTSGCRASLLRRLGYCLLPLLLGAGGALVLLLAASGPTRSAYAGNFTFPGPCGASIQACINGASAGDTIIISAGNYTESLTLSQAVSLTGALSSTTILHALPNSRVLTVTGAAVGSSVVISGLTFSGGLVTGTFTCPQSCGGGVLFTASARPELINDAITNNSAGHLGGGLYNDSSAHVTLLSVAVNSNTAANGGGGLFNAGDLTLTNSTLNGNTTNNNGGGGGNGGTLTVTQSTVSNNTAVYGGGLDNTGWLTLTSSTVSSNTAYDGGGLTNSGTLALADTTVSRNTTAGNCGNCGSGGGLLNYGVLTLTSSWVTSNSATIKCTYFCAAGGGGLDNAGRLTLANSTVSSNTVAGESAVCCALGGGGLLSSGTLVIVNSAVSNNIAMTDPQSCCSHGDGGGLYSYGTLTLTSSTVSSNTATENGGGLYAGGQVAITSSIIASNTAASGGGLYNSGQAYNSTWLLTLTNTTVTSNTAANDGGGLYNAGTLTLTSSTVSRNTAHDGGGVYNGGVLYNLYYPASLLTLVSSTVSGNTAASNGGGLYNTSYGVLLLSQSTVSGNVATAGNSFGGGLYNASFGTLTLTDSTVNNNTAAGGGGLFNFNGSLTLTSSTLTGNTAGGGGGLYSTGAVTLTRSAVTSNTASSDGGGLWIYGTLMIADSTVSDNTASTGGGLHLSGDLVLTGTLFISNTAYSGGAISHDYAGTGRIVNALFARNSATVGGNTLYLGSPGGDAILHATLNGPAAGSGTAIVIVSGTVAITDTIITSDTIGIGLTAGSASEDYNLFFGVPVTVTGGVASGGHSLAGDAAFQDPASDDYHLTAASAARDMGVNAGVASDFEGDPRPMGGGFDAGYDEFRTPVANADNYHVARDGTLLVAGPGVLTNDTDFGLGPMTATLASGPLTGTLDLAADGSFTYTPALGFFGPVTFTYQSNAASLTSAPATVTVVVNQPPVAAAGAGQINIVGQPVTLDGSGSSDPDNNLPLAYGWQQTAGPAVILSSATISRPTFTAPATPAVLTFTLTVSDAYGLASLPATTTVTVTDQALTGLSAASSSPTVLGQATAFTGSLIAGTNVSFSWGFGNGAVGSGAHPSYVYPALGFYPAVVTATNSLGSLTATATVEVDDRPVAASDAYSTTENAALHVAAPGVLANDSDVFPGGLTAQLVSGPATGTLVLASSGAFTFTPPIGFSGLVAFTYRTSDGLLLSPPTLVTITVNAFKLYLPLLRR